MFAPRAQCFDALAPERSVEALNPDFSVEASDPCHYTVDDYLTAPLSHCIEAHMKRAPFQ